jgi:hypothetical protein
MSYELITNAKIASYFIWEYTNGDDPLKLWYCAEDIASWFERRGYLTRDSIFKLLKGERTGFEYIEFTRHIAFRIHLYTDNDDDVRNWFIAERLLFNHEWTDSITSLAVMYSQLNKDGESTGEMNIRSPFVRDFYEF